MDELYGTFTVTRTFDEAGDEHLTAELKGKPLILMSKELTDQLGLSIGSIWEVGKYRLTILRIAPDEFYSFNWVHYEARVEELIP